MSEVIWRNITPKSNWTPDKFFTSIDIVPASNNYDFEIEEWNGSLFLTWNREILEIPFTFTCPVDCYIKFKSDKQNFDKRFAISISRGYDNVTKQRFTMPAPSDTSFGCNIVYGDQFKLPTIPFGTVSPIAIQLESTDQTSLTTLNGSYNEDYSIFTVEEDYVRNSGEWSIVYLYSCSLEKSSITIDEIGLAMKSSSSFLWDGSESSIKWQTTSEIPADPISSTLDTTEKEIYAYNDILYNFRSSNEYLTIRRVHDTPARSPYNDTKDYGYSFDTPKEEKTKFFNGVKTVYTYSNFQDENVKSEFFPTIKDNKITLGGKTYPFERLFYVELTWDHDKTWYLNATIGKPTLTEILVPGKGDSQVTGGWVRDFSVTVKPSQNLTCKQYWLEYNSESQEWDQLESPPAVLRFPIESKTWSYKIASQKEEVIKDIEANGAITKNYDRAIADGNRSLLSTASASFSFTFDGVPEDVNIDNWISVKQEGWFNDQAGSSNQIFRQNYIGWGMEPYTQMHQGGSTSKYYHGWLEGAPVLSFNDFASVFLSGRKNNHDKTYADYSEGQDYSDWGSYDSSGDGDYRMGLDFAAKLQESSPPQKFLFKYIWW